MNRRAIVTAACAFAIALALGGCHKHAEDRCARCGMVIAPKSPWETVLSLPDGTTKRFDTPRCGLRALHEAAAANAASSAPTLRVHEFYDGTERAASDVVFVIGSDVVGPMGPAIVPVDPSRAAKFTADHAGKQTLPLDAVTDAVLQSESP